MSKFFTSMAFILLHSLTFAGGMNVCMENIEERYRVPSARIGARLDMKHCNLTDEDMPALLQFIHEQRKFNEMKLFLDDNFISKEGARILAQYSEDITYLSLKNNQIGDEGAGFLAGKITKYLNLSGNGLSDEGAIKLSQVKNERFTLNLDNNHIGNLGVSALVTLGISNLSIANNQLDKEGIEAISKMMYLSLLDISHNHLRSEDIRSLENLTKLRYLYADHNEIDDAGISRLARLPLQTLSVAHNSFGREGVEAISKNEQLIVLDISDNQLTPEDITALQNHPTLSNLSAHHNHLGNEGAKILASRDTKSYVLDVSHNDITDANALSSPSLSFSLRANFNQLGTNGAKILTRQNNLKKLDIAGNNIGDEGLVAIAASPSCVGSLNVASNHITAEGVRLFLQNRACNNYLTRLNLNDNHLGDDGIQPLAQYSIIAIGIANNDLHDEGIISFVKNLRYLHTYIDVQRNDLSKKSIDALYTKFFVEFVLHGDGMQSIEIFPEA